MAKNEVINLVYIGRMEQEKGFDLVVDFLKSIFFDSQEYKNKVRFFVFGDGKLKQKFLDNFQGITDLFEDNITNLLNKQYKTINYFGRQDKQLIDEVLEISHFTLMPSKFIETFGLVALESCAKWVNVIWYRKWWLANFVLPEFDISAYQWRNDLYKLKDLLDNLITNYSLSKISNMSKLSIEMSEKFTQEIWLDKFKTMFDNKKILMVSDYLPNIWWIENYIIKTKDLLIKNGFEVETFGRNGINWKVPKFLKILWLPCTAWNFWFAKNLKKKIEEFKPDLVWFHSVSRFAGWLPLFQTKSKDYKRWIMYHDLWYFCAYPSKINDEELLYKKMSFWNFIKTANTKNIFKLIWVCFKYLSNFTIYNNLKKDNFDKHLVPSEFMVKILLSQYWLIRDKIEVLEHFRD